MSKTDVAWGLCHFLLSVLVVSAPVAIITGHQATSDEQDQVHKPPDSQASQGQKLPNSSSSVAQAETIHPKASQEEGVQQCGYEIVSSVSVEIRKRPLKLESKSNSLITVTLSVCKPVGVQYVYWVAK